MSNEYTETWFELFLAGIPEEKTASEVAFLQRQLPQPDYRRVLDLCCGGGRHAIPLAGLDYAVTALDRDIRALAQARAHAGNLPINWIEKDMRWLDEIPGIFDAILNMWQSLSYFDETTNDDLLRQISAKLRRGGCFVLDMYHRTFFEQHTGEHAFEIAGCTVHEKRYVRGNRLYVSLEYSDGRGGDNFEWQLYLPVEIEEQAARHALKCLLSCAAFDEQQAPTSQHPRMQLVFEKQA